MGAREPTFGYDSVYSGSIDAEIDAIEAKCKTLKANFEGKMGESLLDAIKAYEEVDIALTKALSYVSLSCDTKLDDDKAQKRKASLFQRYSTISGNELTFFSLELADMSQDLLEAQMEKSPELAKYAAYIDDVRRSQPLQPQQRSGARAHRTCAVRGQRQRSSSSTATSSHGFDSKTETKR
jgi:oligoendopeptidase F